MNTVIPFSPLIVYVATQEELSRHLPLLNALNRPVLVLCSAEIDEEMEVNENILAVAVEDVDDEELWPLLERLHPEGILIMDSNDSILHHGQGLGVPIINIASTETVDEQTAIINREAPCRYLQTGEVHKLHIGCGPFVMAGWLNVDLECNHPEIRYMNAGRAYPFPDNSFDYIFSEHLFEHLSIVEQTVMLKECCRILKPGGRMRLAMPNLHFLMDLYINPEKEINRKYLAWSYRLFGIRAGVNEVSEKDYPIHVINNFFHLWGHQFIHTPESLERMASNIGFADIEAFKIGHSDTLELQDLERHGQNIPSWANELETFVLEMKKTS